MDTRIFFWSLTSSLAGFLFGFDTVVISGAEQTIQALWELSDGLHGLVLSAALWGTVAGSLVGGWQTDRFGRKRTLLAIGVLYLASALWSAIATDVWSFMIARFVGGLGVGISTVAAPLYIAEIAPPGQRGRLAGMFQFNIVLGILVAFLSNAALAGLGPSAWRWMLGVEAVPALLYTALCFQLPQSPRWLIGVRGDREAGMTVLRLIHPDEKPELLAQIADRIALGTTRAQQATKEPFWSTRLKKPIVFAFLVAFFNQLSGINAILYFAPRIFEMSGLARQAALLQSIGIGLTNLVFTFVGLWLIDKMGRRTLLMLGSAGYLVSLGGCSLAFFLGYYSIVPACIFLFIAAHALGSGTVIWVFISEIFPNAHRAAGQTLGSFTHWIFAALLTLLFPTMVSLMHPGFVFLFFCSIMGVQWLWVILVMPETKGVPLEEMEKKLGLGQT